MTMSRLLALSLALCSTGCFLDRSGTRPERIDAGPARVDAGHDAGRDAGHDAGADAGPVDASVPRDANCAPGTFDVDGDPANGCECTPASPPIELCNGIDDDCDADTFDGQAEPLLFEPCDGPDADRCADGAWVCNVDAMACTDPLEDSFEICGTGLDEDCDGATDESTAVGVEVFYRDGDGDGYGDASMMVSACTAPMGFVADGTDCDDLLPDRNPGQAEICNGRDDDCSGVVDDGGACACAVRYRSGVPYQLCTTGNTWDGARLYCETFGYRLVKIDGAAENAWLAGEASALGLGVAWIGLHQNGSDWDWVDGSRASYLPWDTDEPNDGGLFGDAEDCVELRSGPARWNDRVCGDTFGFICEWP